MAQSATRVLYKGGHALKAAAPREAMPPFNCADRRGDQPCGPIVLHVVTGADGAFWL